VEVVHDFVRKLRQDGVLSSVVDYVRWQHARREALAAGRAGPTYPERAPLSINLDLTTACNYACEHCIDLEILNSGIGHDEGVLRASLAEMARTGLRSVILIGGGEPTVHPRFREMVRYLKDLDLQVAIVSNGSRNERIAEIAPLLGAEDWVRLSLDAGTDATFQAMHRPRKPITLEAICTAAQAIKRANPALRLGFSYVITWNGVEREPGAAVTANLHEMEAAARLARDHGFDYISFKPFLVRTSEGAEVMDPQGGAQRPVDLVERIRQGVAAARRLERPGFRVVESTNLKLLESGTWEAWTRQPRTCHMQALRQVLSPQGLWNCPAHRGVPEARIAGPDAFADPARARDAHERLVAKLDGFDASERCREVTCLYHAANWWIEQGITDPAAFAAQPTVDAADFFL
jgi:organic radical activating enzyme